MTDARTPEAGWYDDPEIALRVRWWDGRHWTTHTRPKRVVEHPDHRTLTVAEPGVAAPYTMSAPASWSPSTPAEIDPRRRARLDYTPARTTTAASWALAFTPLVTVLAQTAAVILSGLESTPWVWIAGAAVIPLLWIAIWVRRDRIALHEWGHLERAHWGWALLADVGYLAARTLVVRRQAAGRGWGPLVVCLLLIAVLVNVGVFTPVVGVAISTITL